MILCRKLIEENIFVSEEESGVFEYEWFSSIPSGYEQAKLNDSVLLGIGAFSKRTDKTYNFARGKMISEVISKVNSNFSNWNNGLTASEKLVAIEHLIAPYSLRMSLISDSQDEINANTMAAKLLVNRSFFIETMRKKVFNQVRIENMTLSDSRKMAKDTFSLFNLYITSGDVEFKEWLTNEVGSDFENNGFFQKSYYSETIKINLLEIFDL